MNGLTHAGRVSRTFLARQILRRERGQEKKRFPLFFSVDHRQAGAADHVEPAAAS